MLPIFYCNKGGRGENILRNIVGNKGRLGGGYWYCTIMCNNAPFSVSRKIFFETPHCSGSLVAGSDGSGRGSGYGEGNTQININLRAASCAKAKANALGTGTGGRGRGRGRNDES